MTRRVVFLDYALNGGGAERVMCTILRSFRPGDIDPRVVLVDRAGALIGLVPAHVPVHELRVPRVRAAVLPLARKLRELSPDVVFTTVEHVTVLAVVARLLGGRYRIVARFPSMPDLGRREQVVALAGWRGVLVRALYRRADVVVAQTPEMADELQTHLRIAPRRIRTIPNPLDTELIDQSVRRARNPYEGDAAAVRIVGVGRLTPAKGFDLLVRAFARLRVERPAARLYLVGRDSGSHREELEAIASSLGVRDAVTFAGFHANPFPYLAHADLFVLSSRAEGMPNALLEARYLGLRSVAVECLPVVRRIMCGKYLVPVGDEARLAAAMRTALEEPALPPLAAPGADGFRELLLEA